MAGNLEAGNNNGSEAAEAEQARQAEMEPGPTVKEADDDAIRAARKAQKEAESATGALFKKYDKDRPSVPKMDKMRKAAQERKAYFKAKRERGLTVASTDSTQYMPEDAYDTLYPDAVDLDEGERRQPPGVREDVTALNMHDLDDPPSVDPVDLFGNKTIKPGIGKKEKKDHTTRTLVGGWVESESGGEAAPSEPSGIAAAARADRKIEGGTKDHLEGPNIDTEGGLGKSAIEGVEFNIDDFMEVAKKGRWKELDGMMKAAKPNDLKMIAESEKINDELRLKAVLEIIEGILTDMVAGTAIDVRRLPDVNNAIATKAIDQVGITGVRELCQIGSPGNQIVICADKRIANSGEYPDYEPKYKNDWPNDKNS